MEIRIWVGREAYYQAYQMLYQNWYNWHPLDQNYPMFALLIEYDTMNSLLRLIYQMKPFDVEFIK